MSADEELVDLLIRLEKELQQPTVLLEYILRGDACDGGEGVDFGHVAVETFIDELLGFVVAEHLGGYVL